MDLDTCVSDDAIRPRMPAIRKRGQVVNSALYRTILDGNNSVVWKVADGWSAEPSEGNAAAR